MFLIHYALQVLANSFCRHRIRRRDVKDSIMDEKLEPLLYVKAVSLSQIATDDDAKSTDASGPEQTGELESSCGGSETESVDGTADSDSSSVRSDRDPECVMPNSGSDSEACSARAQPDKRGKLRRRKLRDLKNSRSISKLPRLQRPSTAAQKPKQTEEPQQHIKAVTSALDAWLTCKSIEDSWSQSDGEEIQNQKLDGLKSAMSQLAPHEVALMKAMLDVKLASQ